MNIDLSVADQEFRREVKKFIAQKLPPELRAGTLGTVLSFSEPDIGLVWQRILNERGWAGYTWPVAVGGTGWTLMQRYIFESECGNAGAPTLPVIGLRLLGPVLLKFGTEQQRNWYLPRILSGEHYWCQGFSEPGAGSDLANLKTRAVRTGGSYVINGSKMWTTQAHFASHVCCLVRTDVGARPQAGISFLLVEMSQPGIEWRPIYSMAGDHEVNQTFFTDAHTSIDNLVGEEGQGWEIAKFLLEHERSGANFSARLLADIDRLRSELSGPAAKALRQELTEAGSETHALMALELRIIGQLSKGDRTVPMSSVVKTIASNLRQKIDRLFMIGNGLDGLVLPRGRPFYGPDAPVPLTTRSAQVAAAQYLNGRAWTIFGGSDEIQQTIIASSVLGL